MLEFEDLQNIETLKANQDIKMKKTSAQIIEILKIKYSNKEIIDIFFQGILILKPELKHLDIRKKTE